ncbi:MAG TPA: carbon monoxide dehydrogenase [Armatimonadota bacterium]
MLAVTGKGGVGKTTLSALILQHLLRGGLTPLLAIDADSNANLAEALGVECPTSVGSLREEALGRVAAAGGTGPGLGSGVAKSEWLEYRLQESVVEEQGFDLLAMGRPEGPGCYCFANNVLREAVHRLASSYRCLVIDNEAGMEHLSRRTVEKVDCLLAVSDASVRGIRTAGRIGQVVEEMQARVAHRYLVINRAEPDQPLAPALARAAAELDMPLAAVLPSDPAVARMDAGGMTVDAIPLTSPLRQAVGVLVDQLLEPLTHV